ncbi:SulP family inorganic anion transporter [Marinactinospora rubrisoli]|uniref:carbonic anhydrase n=1 Tax=Marinactinospora rubrisoli TaxID=2715399 RepID=A0ABW2KE81_9ACTN
MPETRPPESAPPPVGARLRRTLAGDLGASFVVFLVAVPLSLGIAVASGAPLVAGLIAAVVGGVVAAAFGGSAVQVSGPAAGLTVIVADLVHTYGWRVTCLITLLAGVVQLALGACRVARAALAISPSVIHGMLAGVGVTIAVAQAHVLLGGAPHGSALADLTELPGRLAAAHWPSLLVGLTTIAVMLVWSRLPALGRLRPGLLPAALVAVVTATAVAAGVGRPVERVALPDSLAEAWSGPALPALADLHGVAVGVVTVALVAGVESLLCAIAVDRLHDGRRVRLDRELAGQGAANVASGALGGLPVAGVIVRSTANARAGGRTPLAAILHGVWILAFVGLFANVVELVPMAALAGLLVFVGVQMVDLARLRDLRRHREAGVHLVTLAGVVVLGLLEGVLVGLALAALLALRRLARLSVRTEDRAGRWHVVVRGSLTFLGVPRVARALREIPAGTSVDLDLNVDFMDHAAFEAVHAWRLDHERTGGAVDIDEIHEKWYERASNRTPPTAKTLPPAPLRWWAPWAMRRETGGDARVSGLLLAGARDYHESTAAPMRPLLSRLASGQRPQALFITCTDSRVVPNVITASGPGDLFTLRNLGNLVPPHEPRASRAHDASVGAAVEYAVAVLEVPAVVVCGHSHCGAMQALLEGVPAEAGDSDTAHVARWLRHGAATLARFPDLSASLPPAERVDRLGRLNVVQQLEHLLGYPAVRRRYEEGRLELTGLYFDLETARVQVLDERRERFLPVPSGTVPRPRPSGDVPVTDRSDPPPTSP